jgi:hypothetical protein
LQKCGPHGERLRIKGCDRKKFNAEVEQFIVNKKRQDKSFELWPLVKVVQIFIKADFLKDTLVLVQFPSEVVRRYAPDTMSKDYMKTLSVICVLSKMIRAADGMSAQLLLHNIRRSYVEHNGIWDHQSPASLPLTPMPWTPMAMSKIMLTWQRH